MRRDIDDALKDWPHDPEPGELQVREVRGKDNRTVLQVRIELGLMQMEVDGRPDGRRPHGFPTYLQYLKHRSGQQPKGAGKSTLFAMSGEHCLEADRELVQFYHRRITWLALQRYEKALEDADHSLDMMNFVDVHGPSEEYKLSHERYRGLVLFHRTQAAVASALAAQDAEAAIDAVLEGRGRLTKYQESWVARVEQDDTPNEQLVEQLRLLESEIRKKYPVAKTLREQLDEAVAAEDYETAARLRDVIRLKDDPN